MLLYNLMMKLYLQLSLGLFALSVVPSDFALHQPAIVMFHPTARLQADPPAPLSPPGFSSDDHSQRFPPDVKIGNTLAVYHVNFPSSGIFHQDM